jgi:hypothetical protein
MNAVIVISCGLSLCDMVALDLAEIYCLGAQTSPRIVEKTQPYAVPLACSLHGLIIIALTRTGHVVAHQLCRAYPLHNRCS